MVLLHLVGPFKLALWLNYEWLQELLSQMVIPDQFQSQNKTYNHGTIAPRGSLQMFSSKAKVQLNSEYIYEEIDFPK